MMQQMPNQPMVVTMAPPPNGRREDYSSKQAIVLGVIQIIIGGICFVCQIAAIVNGDLLSRSGVAIWGGTLMILAGGLGIGAAKRKSNCLIVAVMIMSILASLSAVLVVGFASGSLASRGNDNPKYDYNERTIETRKDCVVTRCRYSYSPYFSTGSCTTTRDRPCQVRLAMNSILVLCGVAEFVAAIWASALSCAVTCCRPKPHTTQNDRLQQTRGQVAFYSGPASQICQITSTGGLLAMPNTAIGHVQYTAPGQVVVLQQPVPSAGAYLPSYAQATTQQQTFPNYAQAPVHQHNPPAYYQATAPQAQPEVNQPQSTEPSKTSAQLM